MTLTAPELTWMRTAVSDIWPDTCAIYPVTAGKDDLGAYRPVGGNVVSDIPCQFTAVTRDTDLVRVLADRLKGEMAHEVLLPFDQDIEVGHELYHNFVSYKMVWVDDDSSYLTHKRCIVQRTTEATLNYLVANGVHMTDDEGNFILI